MIAHHQRGFTLLELIIAVGIFAILSALAYSGLNAVLKTSAHTKEVSQELQDLQTAMSLIEQDLSQLVDRPARDEFGTTKAALIAEEGTDKAIIFTRSGWRNPVYQPRSTLQRVFYRLDEDSLIRGYWTTLDQAPNASPITLPLLKGVDSIKFEFTREGKPPTTSWPPLGDDGQSVKGLPQSLRLILETRQWGTLSRLFPIGGQ